MDWIVIPNADPSLLKAIEAVKEQILILYFHYKVTFAKFSVPPFPMYWAELDISIPKEDYTVHRKCEVFIAIKDDGTYELLKNGCSKQF